MNKLRVFLQYTPEERRLVGQLAESRGRIYFEYDPQFLRSPLWLSPFKLPPEPGLHEHKDLAFGPLFGMFDDSLPDGWGFCSWTAPSAGPDAIPTRSASWSVWPTWEPKPWARWFMNRPWRARTT